MSVVLQTNWLADALVSEVATHHTPATLTLGNGIARVMTYPFDENTIRIKYCECNVNSDTTIKITDTFRQFVKNCVNVFQEITLLLNNENELIISALSLTQALKYRLQVVTTRVDHCIPRDKSEITLIIPMTTFINSWELFFSKMITLSCYKGQKRLKMHSERPKTTAKDSNSTNASEVDLATFIECKTEAVSDKSFTCHFSSGRIFKFLQCGNECISLSFLQNGLLAVGSEGETVFLVPK